MALVGKRTNKIYGFGDKVTVKVIGADKDKSQVDFEIYEGRGNFTYCCANLPETILCNDGSRR